MTTRTHILGFPRMGARRELSFALEQHGRGELDLNGLEAVGAALRARHWQAQRDAGLDFVTVGDFAFHDTMAHHIQLLGCEPPRFDFKGDEPELARHFKLAHGSEAGAALASRPWFDTAAHCLVPEFTSATRFGLASVRLFEEVAQAQAAGHPVKVALLGPLSFLYLGEEKEAGFDRFALLDALLPVYEQLLSRLKKQGVEWVQLDEPMLGLDLPAVWRNAFERSYWQLARSAPKLLLATYFSPLADNLRLACQLPVAGLHVDAVRAPEELVGVADWLPSHKVLSVGIIDGRNVWRTDPDAALARLQPLADKHRGELWIAPSCSLLHVPHSVAAEDGLDAELRSWLAFAIEKLDELQLVRALLDGREASVAAPLQAARAAVRSRRASSRVHRADVALRMARSVVGDDRRASALAVRAPIQRARLAQASPLSVPVQGAAEPQTSLCALGERLDGFAFTAHGWVQCGGARCVKPLILFGDVARLAPMAGHGAVPVQRLTGPVTLLQRAFVRNDQPLSITAEQIAWALRDEVVALERAGIAIIEIDETALHEGLPLRRAGWKAYLESATRAFRISASGVTDATQIHTHMRHSEFKDLLPDLLSMDADVITLETRAGIEVLRGAPAGC